MLNIKPIKRKIARETDNCSYMIHLTVYHINHYYDVEKEVKQKLFFIENELFDVFYALRLKTLSKIKRRQKRRSFIIGRK